MAIYKRRIEREKRTVTAMIYLYCRKRHARKAGLCADCANLLDYALARLDKCPFADGKPTCAKCPIHCYRPVMRKEIQAVMRYAGPRMLLAHPLLAVAHMLDGLKKPPPKPSHRRTEP